MIHLGDITKISGYNIDPVDCITFGSPCQDLSQAGKRAGLDGERSGLFIHAVRIIKEMRENTNGRHPTFAIWENVPGAFSSNRGEDFRTVLEKLARIKQADASIPGPEKNKWAKAGIVCGDGYSIALPQWWWITCKMGNYLPKSATLGSLFDGIGGFPLVWETFHGKGTAVWASEIEEFPIAVTKKWFA